MKAHDFFFAVTDAQLADLQWNQDGVRHITLEEVWEHAEGARLDHVAQDRQGQQVRTKLGTYVVSVQDDPGPRFRQALEAVRSKIGGAQLPPAVHHRRPDVGPNPKRRGRPAILGRAGTSGAARVLLDVAAVFGVIAGALWGVLQISVWLSLTLGLVAGAVTAWFGARKRPTP